MLALRGREFHALVRECYNNVSLRGGGGPSVIGFLAASHLVLTICDHQSCEEESALYKGL